jgi:cell division protein FtsW (lipid II flippase)
MNLGLMPVTGVPLPLISYGGSAILVNMLALGLVQMQIISNEPKVVVERLV